jgi:hypothetical protein
MEQRKKAGTDILVPALVDTEMSKKAVWMIIICGRQNGLTGYYLYPFEGSVLK